MDRFKFKQNVGRLVGQRNCFLIFAFILSIAVAFLSILLLFKKEKLVIIPTSGSSYWIEEDKASSIYIEKMGLFLSDLLLNRSPADVEKRNRMILEYVHPSSYHEIRKQLQQEQANLLRTGQSFFFRSHRSYADSARNAFCIEGELYVLIGKEGVDSYCSQSERKKYTLRFCCENGRLWLTSLNKEQVNTCA